MVYQYDHAAIHQLPWMLPAEHEMPIQVRPAGTFRETAIRLNDSTIRQFLSVQAWSFDIFIAEQSDDILSYPTENY